MKFLKVHPQRAINIDKIVGLHVTGRETDAHLEIDLSDGTGVTASRHKSFREAEIAMIELIDQLEGME